MYKFLILVLFFVIPAHANQIDQIKRQAELGDTNVQSMLGACCFIGWY